MVSDTSRSPSNPAHPHEHEPGPPRDLGQADQQEPVASQRAGGLRHGERPANHQLAREGRLHAARKAQARRHLHRKRIGGQRGQQHRGRIDERTSGDDERLSRRALHRHPDRSDDRRRRRSGASRVELDGDDAALECRPLEGQRWRNHRARSHPRRLARLPEEHQVLDQRLRMRLRARVETVGLDQPLPYADAARHRPGRRHLPANLRPEPGLVERDLGLWGDEGHGVVRKRGRGHAGDRIAPGNGARGRRIGQQPGVLAARDDRGFEDLAVRAHGGVDHLAPRQRTCVPARDDQHRAGGNRQGVGGRQRRGRAERRGVRGDVDGCNRRPPDGQQALQALLPDRRHDDGHGVCERSGRHHDPGLAIAHGPAQHRRHESTRCRKRRETRVERLDALRRDERDRAVHAGPPIAADAHDRLPGPAPQRVTAAAVGDRRLAADPRSAIEARRHARERQAGRVVVDLAHGERVRARRRRADHDVSRGGRGEAREVRGRRADDERGPALDEGRDRVGHFVRRRCERCHDDAIHGKGDRRDPAGIGGVSRQHHRRAGQRVASRGQRDRRRRLVGRCRHGDRQRALRPVARRVLRARHGRDARSHGGVGRHRVARGVRRVGNMCHLAATGEERHGLHAAGIPNERQQPHYLSRPGGRRAAQLNVGRRRVGYRGHGNRRLGPPLIAGGIARERHDPDDLPRRRHGGHRRDAAHRPGLGLHRRLALDLDSNRRHPVVVGRLRPHLHRRPGQGGRRRGQRDDRRRLVAGAGARVHRHHDVVHRGQRSVTRGQVKDVRARGAERRDRRRALRIRERDRAGPAPLRPRDVERAPGRLAVVCRGPGKRRASRQRDGLIEARIHQRRPVVRGRRVRHDRHVGRPGGRAVVGGQPQRVGSRRAERHRRRRGIRRDDGGRGGATHLAPRQRRRRLRLMVGIVHARDERGGGRQRDWIDRRDRHRGHGIRRRDRHGCGGRLAAATVVGNGQRCGIGSRRLERVGSRRAHRRAAVAERPRERDWIAVRIAARAGKRDPLPCRSRIGPSRVRERQLVDGGDRDGEGLGVGAPMAVVDGHRDNLPADLGTGRCPGDGSCPRIDGHVGGSGRETPRQRVVVGVRRCGLVGVGLQRRRRRRRRGRDAGRVVDRSGRHGDRERLRVAAATPVGHLHGHLVRARLSGSRRPRDRPGGRTDRHPARRCRKGPRQRVAVGVVGGGLVRVGLQRGGHGDRCGCDVRRLVLRPRAGNGEALRQRCRLDSRGHRHRSRTGLRAAADHQLRGGSRRARDRDRPQRAFGRSSHGDAGTEAGTRRAGGELDVARGDLHRHGAARAHAGRGERDDLGGRIDDQHGGVGAREGGTGGRGAGNRYPVPRGSRHRNSRRYGEGHPPHRPGCRDDAGRRRCRARSGACGLRLQVHRDGRGANGGRGKPRASQGDVVDAWLGRRGRGRETQANTGLSHQACGSPADQDCEGEAGEARDSSTHDRYSVAGRPGNKTPRRGPLEGGPGTHPPTPALTPLAATARTRADCDGETGPEQHQRARLRNDGAVDHDLRQMPMQGPGNSNRLRARAGSPRSSGP